jgi:hypothetical protein
MPLRQKVEATAAEDALAMEEVEVHVDPADLETDEAAIEAAVEAAEGITFDHSDSKSLIQCIRGLQEGQTQQTQLIQKLHKTVLNTRTIINELIVTQNELKDEIERLKSPSVPSPPAPAATPSSIAAPAPAQTTIQVQSTAGSSPDDEIDAIIDARARKSQWPVKHSTLNCFSVQQDLVKLRFHNSAKYQHIPVRIPKTEKNKDGTKPCKLCSEGKVRRKTTWMCAVCEVPLCTRPLMGEESAEGGVTTHHARWHSARDLVAEHVRVHALLRDGRESRKRNRESMIEEHHAMLESPDEKIEESLEMQVQAEEEV